MEETHSYRVSAWWTSGKTGLAKCDSAPNAIHFTAPPQFGGFEGRWTPEDLLLTAIASCYTSTFRVLADYSKLEYADLEVDVAGTVKKVDSGYCFTEVVTRPSLTIAREKDRGSALRVLEKTQKMCLVARILSVKHLFEPRVEVRVPAPQ